MRNKLLRAFTMVELLIAMAIIGLLIAIAIWGISLAQLGARNTQRRQVGSEVLAAMSEYYSRYNEQPAAAYWVTPNTIRIANSVAPSARFYDISAPASSAPLNAAWVAWSYAAYAGVPQANWWEVSSNTFYILGSGINGYKVCVGLEGSSSSFTNLSEKPTLVPCP